MVSWLILGLTAAGSMALFGLLRRPRAAGKRPDSGVSVFIGPNGSGCAVRGGAVGDAVFDRLKRLPGVDYEAVITAMGSADNASFEVWKRP